MHPAWCCRARSNQQQQQQQRQQNQQHDQQLRQRGTDQQGAAVDQPLKQFTYKQLQLHTLIADSSSAQVFRGFFQGQPAIMADDQNHQLGLVSLRQLHL